MHHDDGPYLPARLALLPAARYFVTNLTERPGKFAQSPGNRVGERPANYRPASSGPPFVARAIHRRSDRASRAFISVNCAAIPRDLIATELFGHEKVPSRAQLSSASVGLNWQMEARFSSTKSENFLRRLRLPSCVFCRSTSLSVSAAVVESALTFG